MTLPVARVTDRVFAMVQVGDHVVPQIGRIISGSRDVLVESAQFGYMNSRVVFPNTVGYITGKIARRVIVNSRNAALLTSTVTGGAIVGNGTVITGARRVLAPVS